MPIRKQEKKAAGTAVDAYRTGEYSRTFSPPQSYKPIQAQQQIVTSIIPGAIPTISTRDIGYFFNVAASLYSETQIASAAYHSFPPLSPDAPPGYDASPPSYGQDYQSGSMDPTAVLVMRLFRQTRIDIFPIAERFHLGPADRQPLYSLNAQPSIRSAAEYNELTIQRRDPIHGVWHNICTSDIEPSLDLAKPGNWTVARLVMEAMPVWHKVVAGSVVARAPIDGKSNSLQISWGDRQTLGALGDVYGLWWDNGGQSGLAEAFYVVEGWQGFDSHPRGLIRIKPAVRDAAGRYQNPRLTPIDLATIYFHSDGKSPPQFVCTDAESQVRLDIIMAGLMTVMVVETRKVAVRKEFGALPAYDSDAHWSSPMMEEGIDLGDA